MDTETMTYETFENLLTAYGGVPTRWPEAERDAMLHFAQTDAKAKALLAREAQLDNWLDAALPEPDNALHQALLDTMDAALKAQAPAREAPHNTGQTADGKLTELAMHRGAAASARRAYGLAIAAMAACFALGFIAAPIIFDTMTSDGDLLASLEIISDTFLPTEPL